MSLIIFVKFACTAMSRWEMNKTSYGHIRIKRYIGIMQKNRRQVKTFRKDNICNICQKLWWKHTDSTGRIWPRLTLLLSCSSYMRRWLKVLNITYRNKSHPVRRLQFHFSELCSTSEANFIYIQMAAKIRSLSTKCSAKLPNESVPNYRKVSFTH